MNDQKRLARRDVCVLSLVALLLTLKPYYLRGELNFFELGLYLPGINAILDGKIPFRDFFYLRGPFELYVPALMMKCLGENVAVLASYFYFGTLLVMLSCVWIASQILRTRLFFYLLIPVLITRTFPRVVFTYWGGCRYAWGLLSIFAALRFLNGKGSIWIFFAGILSACAFFTSIEVGMCSIVAIASALSCGLFIEDFKERARKGLRSYFLGSLTIAGPYLTYLQFVGGLSAYIETVWTVLTRLYVVANLHYTSVLPQNFSEVLKAMLNPAAENFRHVTPLYLFLAVIVFLALKVKKGGLETVDLKIICLGSYGLIMLLSSLRAPWASQFEMALQPEKILLFFCLEEVFLSFRNLRREGSAVTKGIKRFFYQKSFVIGLLTMVILSSMGYAIQRLNHRFWGRKNLVPILDQATTTLTLRRLNGMTVPTKQADEIKQVSQFFEDNTRPGEPVFMFPELGIYSFIVDRPFVGRFSMITLSWFKDSWHREIVSDLTKSLPNYAVLSKILPESFEQTYFKRAENKQFYDEVMEIIHRHYHLELETSNLQIYKLKSS